MTAYHPQTNEHVERCNRTIPIRLRHCIAGHQQNWDFFVQPLTYAYNTELHRSTNTSMYRLVLIPLPTGPLLLRADSDRLLLSKLETSPQQMRALLQARILPRQNKTDAHLWKSQARFKTRLGPQSTRNITLSHRKVSFHRLATTIKCITLRS